MSAASLCLFVLASVFFVVFLFVLMSLVLGFTWRYITELVFLFMASKESGKPRSTSEAVHAACSVKEQNL